MRARVVMVLTVIAISAGVAGPPAGADTRAESTPTGRVCASYLTGDTFTGFTSQNFEPEFHEYDDVGADDLEVSRRCRARALTVVGTYFSSNGPARSETVTFYRDKNDRPGRVLSTETVVGEDIIGTFEIVLDRAVRLRPGRTYWLSAQVNMDFVCCGQWGWMLRAGEGTSALWRNPGDGWGSGCIDWTPVPECYPGAPGEEFMFEVRTR